MVVLLLEKKNILSSEVINNLYVKHKVHVKKKMASAVPQS